MYAAPPTNRAIIQTAYVVEDLERAAHDFAKTLGVGPFYITERPQIRDATYRGQPSAVEFSTAITQAGGVQLELVQQHCDSPSCYRDSVAAGGRGFHHIAVFAEDYDTEMERYDALGIEVAAAGRMGRMRFAYMDTTAQIMGMTEVLEDTPFIRDYFSALIAVCNAWDGERLIRPASELF